MYINIKSEYSFRHVFAPVEKIVEKCKKAGFCGIADINNTFVHVPLEKACDKAGIKPIYGVSISCTIDLEEKDRRGHLNLITLIAKTKKGLNLIYKTVEIAYQQFWFVPRITYHQLATINKNDVIILSGHALPEDMKKGYYQEISPGFPKGGIISGRKQMACIDNNYINEKDKAIYETFADNRLLERKTFPQHLLNHQEWNKLCKNKKAISNLLELVKEIDDIKLSKSPLIKYDHKSPEKKLKKWCIESAKILKINLGKGKYKKRFDREFSIIKEKGYVDYLLLNADLVKEAKKIMMVGPGRGSSGGSLICFLLGITLIDSIKRGTIFERFIDLNRTDLPDIDIDFQHDKREKVIPILSKKYHVSPIANIIKLTPKININRTAKNLFIPQYDLTELKNLIPEQKADVPPIKELFKTEQGDKVTREYPRIKDCIPLENHALHSSTHAAGLIVSNTEITNFTSILTMADKSKNKRVPVANVDMESCEHLNLLKVDALALKTLTILAETCDLLGEPYEYLYNLKDGNKKAYTLINSGDLEGVFQLEGRTMKGLLKKIKIKSIPDISDISSIGRPGPMKSGSANKYLKRRKGEKYKLPDNHKTIKKITAPTYGVIIYQEQIMEIARKYAQMPWEDVIKLRKVVAKSKGSEELQKFREQFIKKAKGKNPGKIWDMIKTFGSYGFNKSHSIAYGTITYWCAYLKANHLLEFVVSLLNVSDNDEQSIKVLRYLKEQKGIKHLYFNKNAGLKWKIHKKKLVAPLTSIHGIGPQNAKSIIKSNREGLEIKEGIQKHLNNKISPFRYLYPRKELYSDYSGTNIIDIKKEKEFQIVGKLLQSKLKDSNSIENVNRRGFEVDGPTTYLNIIVADDTAEMMCIINRYSYVEIGKEISETGEEEKTWYYISGKYSSSLNILFIDEIEDITK